MEVRGGPLELGGYRLMVGRGADRAVPVGEGRAVNMICAAPDYEPWAPDAAQLEALRLEAEAYAGV
eukprot:4574048-Lingulodinium_polyedra.AAC.1